MHILEYLLLTTARAVEADEISKAELIRNLETMATASHTYEPSDQEETNLRPLHREYHRRFEPLLNGPLQWGEDR
jgi:hypothetical protein